MSFCIGIIVGAVVATLFFWNPWTAYGILKIDHSNPEKDTYRFEMDDINDLQSRKIKQFILKVDHNANLSQK